MAKKNKLKPQDLEHNEKAREAKRVRGKGKSTNFHLMYGPGPLDAVLAEILARYDKDKIK